MKKIQTHRYSLKYKKKYANRSVMVCCQFFLLKTNRLFLVRDAIFKINQKKIRRIQDFLHHFAGETENKINFNTKNNSNSNNFKENYWEKIFSFRNYVYLKIGFSRKNGILHILTRKNSHTCKVC
jgi:hypothetical protein